MKLFLVFTLFWSCTICASTIPQYETLEGGDDAVEESSPYRNIYGINGQVSQRQLQLHGSQTPAHLFDTPSFSPFSHNPSSGSSSGRHGPNNFRNFPKRSHHHHQQEFDQDEDDQDDDGGSGSGASSGNGFTSKNKPGANKIHKFISIHVAPPEEASQEKPKPIRPPSKGEKHFQIVFIKAPSSSPQEPQEVHLPPPPITRTLVYVLLKKSPPPGDMVRIKGAPTPKPTPPEVFFIRYKGQKEQEGQEGEQEQNEEQDSDTNTNGY